jgi:hypothetical protein
VAHVDLGNIWKHSALLGAGFSHNWGGYLASEMWGAMLGDALIERSARLRQLLLEEPDFEVALAEVRVREDRYTDEDRAALEAVVRNAFDLHDQNLRHKLGDIDGAVPLWQDFYEMMLRPLVDAPNERRARSFLFTLNQDLFIERALCRSHPIAPRLPGVSWNFNSDVPAPWFPKTPGRWHLDLLDPKADIASVATADFGRIELGGACMNVIKLHGSYNWRTTGPGDEVMVLGGAKEVSIARYPILSFYFDVFRSVCLTEGMRLLIVGYSFRDTHVNEIIAQGVREKGLKLFIIDPKPPSQLRSQLVLGRYGDIWEGVHAYVSRPVSEAFGRSRRGDLQSGEALQIRRAVYRGVYE